MHVLALLGQVLNIMTRVTSIFIPHIPPFITEGVFTWENSHRCEFHTAMKFIFCIVFTPSLGHFISRYLKVHFILINTHVIPNCKHYACTTSSSLPADWFHTEMSGRFTFTWYWCKISYQSEILTPVQQRGWTHAGVTHTDINETNNNIYIHNIR